MTINERNVRTIGEKEVPDNDQYQWIDCWKYRKRVLIRFMLFWFIFLYGWIGGLMIISGTRTLNNIFVMIMFFAFVPFIPYFLYIVSVKRVGISRTDFCIEFISYKGQMKYSFNQIDWNRTTDYKLFINNERGGYFIVPEVIKHLKEICNL